MNRTDLTRELYQHRLVAVVRSKSAGEALALAEAAVDGGIKFVEVTFSVPGALDVIKELSTRKGLHVGAGTVMAPQQAERAIGVGAEFVVSPSLEISLIGLCHTADIACFPGAATPTEIIVAQRARADLVKIFPADLLGGPQFIQQMRGPFPDVRFMVSGGVSLENVVEYINLGVTGICLGSAYLDKLLAERGKVRFVKEVGKFVALVAKPRKTNTVEKNKR
jgi:2-dehydro-3-deoxyphosphogluconate aldolase/(4S)-4-hydroxy-2-oxoglutarate aldolase